MRKKKKHHQKFGVCKLTHEAGKFVKSHIIPKALTYPEKSNRPFLQVSKSKGGPKKRCSLPEFSDVELSPEDLECLRLMLVSGNTEPLNFYPAALVQITTLGRIHNLTPIRDLKKIPNFDGRGVIEVPMYRFYFDGLIIHIHNSSCDNAMERYGPNMIGGGSELMVVTQTFESSFQRKNLDSLTKGIGIDGRGFSQDQV